MIETLEAPTVPESGILLMTRDSARVFYSADRWRSPHDGREAQPGRWRELNRMEVDAFILCYGDAFPSSPGEWVDLGEFAETRDVATSLEILSHAALCVHANAWADATDEYGDGVRGEVLDQCGEPGYEAWEIAAAFLAGVTRANLRKAGSLSLPLSIALHWRDAAKERATKLSHRGDRDPSAETFGHYLMMEGLGHGVSWEDSVGAPHGLDVPYVCGALYGPDDVGVGDPVGCIRCGKDGCDGVPH